MVSASLIAYKKVSTHSRPKAAGSLKSPCKQRLFCFNTQPPEGGWPEDLDLLDLEDLFQHTAARRRLATDKQSITGLIVVSTHSRPKAAGSIFSVLITFIKFQHTAARRRLVLVAALQAAALWFQHTAARRRLGLKSITFKIIRIVSTHSRPKAAGASFKSLAPSSFAAPISLSSQEKREREYNTAFSVTPAFAIS